MLTLMWQLVDGKSENGMRNQSNQNYCIMEATLFRNGYNVERRKMYIENPRHNLRSSVDFVWRQSLGDSLPNDYIRRKETSVEITKDSYNKAIEKRIQDELKINKSTFRVMPAPSPHKTIEQERPKYYDSLNREVQQQISGRRSFFDSPQSSRNQPGPASSRDLPGPRSSLSNSVFGYDIDKVAFQKESYLSKVLGDRLQPYLRKQEPIPRHKSFTINQPISLQY